MDGQNMSLTVRTTARDDEPAVAALAADFATHLRGLGDSGGYNLTADALRSDGFGPRAAFAGLVAAPEGAPEDALVGYLLYHLGYDADLAARNL
jgi:hypothetical protein